MLHTLPFVQVWAWPKEMSIDDIHKARAKLQENMEVGAVRLNTCDTMCSIQYEAYVKLLESYTFLLHISHSRGLVAFC